MPDRKKASLSFCWPRFHSLKKGSLQLETFGTHMCSEDCVIGSKDLQNHVSLCSRTYGLQRTKTPAKACLKYFAREVWFWGEGMETGEFLDDEAFPQLSFVQKEFCTSRH